MKIAMQKEEETLSLTFKTSKSQLELKELRDWINELLATEDDLSVSRVYLGSDTSEYIVRATTLTVEINLQTNNKTVIIF
jgi:hypothetical protein